MANFHAFEPPTSSGKAFLGGSRLILASKAYIHYGPWLLCPDEPLKHLFMASGNLKKALNSPQNSQFSWFWTPYKFWDAFLGRPGWILASKAYIHYEPWLLCPDKRLKHLFIASGSLKKALTRPQNSLLKPQVGPKKASKWFWFWTPNTFWESFFGWTMVDPCL